MAINSGAPSSRRGYLSQAELKQYANILINDTDEADDVISQAEEIIDSYVGYQQSFFQGAVNGRCASAGGASTLYLDSDQQSVYQKDYFKGCEIEILGGTGTGQRRRISASDYADGKITVADAWDTTPDTTSFYRIYQLGKFPRREDVTYYTDSTPYQYYKQIPEAVKRATAAQVEFFKEMGTGYFASDKSSKDSERIMSYSYTRAKGQGSEISRMIAPKAKAILKAVRNRVGEIV